MARVSIFHALVTHMFSTDSTRGRSRAINGHIFTASMTGRIDQAGLCPRAMGQSLSSLRQILKKNVFVAALASGA